MAGDWIKMRSNLWDDPRVARICDLTGEGEAAVIGALYWLWASADQHSEDGAMPGLTLRQIDRKTGVSGIGSALVAIGWIEEIADGVRIARFDEHNGASAKRRSMDAQRKASVRKTSASSADTLQTTSGELEDKTRRIAELEKELEKEKKKQEQELPSSTGEKPAEEPADPIFGTGLALLVRKGVPEKSARSFLGMFRKTCADDLVAAELLVRAEVEDVSEPVAWLTKAAKTRKAVPQLSLVPPPKPEPVKASHRDLTMPKSLPLP